MKNLQEAFRTAIMVESARGGRATDRTIAFLLLPMLREFLFRQGCRVEHISDDELLYRVRNTFASTNARAGGISTATPVESELQGNPTEGR